MAEAGEAFVAVDEPDNSGVGKSKLGKVDSFDSEDTPTKKTTTRRLGSMRDRSSDDGRTPTTYDDSDLKEIDMLPMEEQDAEHNWEALNQRILERMNEEHKWMVQHKIIHPMGPFRKRWDAIQVLLLAYVAMLVPCEYSMPRRTSARQAHRTHVAQTESALTTMRTSKMSCSGLMWLSTLTSSLTSS